MFTVLMIFYPLHIIQFSLLHFFFFFNDTATTEIYTLSLHDALPIFRQPILYGEQMWRQQRFFAGRSEEHTSELQSRVDLVCRLLLEKKKKKISTFFIRLKIHNVNHVFLFCGGL